MKFDKYKLYLASVQDPEADVDFFEMVWGELRPKKKLISLKEDFCGTFAVCCQWVKSDDSRQATGVDLDKIPLQYGLDNYYSKLNSAQQNRITIHNKNVLDLKVSGLDIVTASNFSYYIFKERKKLLAYFKVAKSSINKNGLFVIDCFGGSDCYEPNEDSTKYKDFTYYWDQDSYNPINNAATFYIHFKRKNEKKRNKVFSYDWRLWSIPELRDALYDAGFSKTHVYWEGTDDKGDGNGVYTRTNQGEVCESWIAYIVAEK